MLLELHSTMARAQAEAQAYRQRAISQRRSKDMGSTWLCAKREHCGGDMLARGLHEGGGKLTKIGNGEKLDDGQ